MKLKPVAVLIAALCTTSVVASAQSTSASPSPSIFTFSGFGTLGAVKTDTANTQFVSPGQSVGAKDEINFSVDSLIGGQVSAKFSAEWSSVIQILSKNNSQSSQRPNVEWAFAKYQPSQGVSIRGGRIGAPYFMVSDSRSIGYANLWVRPPVDVYGQVALSSFDGVDVLLQKSFGDNTVNAQVFAGNSTSRSPSSGSTIKLDVKNLKGVNVTVENGPVTFRLGYAEADLTAERPAGLVGLFATLRAVGFADLVRAIDVDAKKTSFAGAGVSVDHNNFIFNGEYTQRKSDSYVADTTGWYTTFGYRIGKYTPYAIVSQVKTDSPKQNGVVPRVGPLLPLSLGVDGVIGGPEQSTRGIGVRYDGFKSIAIKGQIERIEPKGGTSGFFTRTTGTIPTSVNVFSLAADFVF